MPTQDGLLDSRDLCDSSVLERTLADESVGSLKIQKNLQSDNFVTGTSGWEINRDTGSVEFQDATIRGTLNASDITAGTMSVSFLDTGTITAKTITLSNSASSILKSGNYSAGSAGWQILGNGNAEFNDVTIRGTLSTSTITGNLTMDGTGQIRTNSTGARFETSRNSGEDTRWYSATEGPWTAGMFTYLTGASGFALQAFLDTGDEPAALFVQKEAAGNAIVRITEDSTGGTKRDMALHLELSSNSAIDTMQLIDAPSSFTKTYIRGESGGSQEFAIESGGVFDGGGAIIDGTVDLQDAGITEWQLRANTSDNFQILDDDGTARFQINQTGSMDFREDDGTLNFQLDGTSADFDAGNDQTFVLVLPVKTTTGQATAIEGAMVVNTEGTIRELRLYANGAWRTIGSW